MSPGATLLLVMLVAEPEPPWPVAVVTGEVSVERCAELPVAIAGTIVDASKEAPEHAVHCSLEGRAWRCSVPARHPLHLRLAFDDYAPVYIWDLDAAAGELDTGIHTLVRGASVVGRVIGENATLTLLPITSAHQPVADRTVTALRTKADARGWFRFTSVTTAARLLWSGDRHPEARRRRRISTATTAATTHPTVVSRRSLWSAGLSARRYSRKPRRAESPALQRDVSEGSQDTSSSHFEILRRLRGSG